MKTVAIISAAGCGKRMGRPKQFLEICGRSILERTLAVFESTQLINEIILVVNAEDIEKAGRLKFSKIKKIVAGGRERRASVFNGLKALSEEAEIVVIHDGARPFVTTEIIEQAIAEARQCGAVVVGVPSQDTIKKVESRTLNVERSLNREEIWAAQTPQVFKKEIILQAYQNQSQATDDAMLVEKMGLPVKMVMGSYRNIKITTPEDLEIAEGLINRGAKND
ncbi:2-C-methyl-D-erythritol 4-phosphate cytidylyltransferase [candidate division WOR-1 bacterium RIFCSPLOWO2_12_FULL_45_9]|uniref:2-C-methyl-D-erythritol 4-phosphate cytidylyltransferase n=1 Tax=candidate division WOR-1 bacterium RIFCSPLOWO2_12_FULL_45_9 TaxID=1802568 RepID=A0A1F4RMH9_UNCSA|nr:MAG: 2-C-methyl-D-erythritol 4-phosphate cytidylyltransferase [candidate division WOR-1 bacterium RIFCSPLOWO2_12_FULL_45_9]